MTRTLNGAYIFIPDLHILRKMHIHLSSRVHRSIGMKESSRSWQLAVSSWSPFCA